MYILYSLRATARFCCRHSDVFVDRVDLQRWSTCIKQRTVRGEVSHTQETEQLIALGKYNSPRISRFCTKKLEDSETSQRCNPVRVYTLDARSKNPRECEGKSSANLR